MRRKNSPSTNSRLTSVKQYKGPAQFFQKPQPPLANRQKSNLRNYFYAQKQRTIYKRPYTSTDNNANRNQKKQPIQRLYSAKTKNQCQAQIVGVLKPFFMNAQQGPKKSQSKKIIQNINSVIKDESSSTFTHKKSQVYERIIADVNEYFNAKASSYKRKQRINLRDRRQFPIDQIIYQSKFQPDNNLNITGLKPTTFWSAPKTANRVNQSKKFQKNSLKLLTEQVVKQFPQRIIKYNSNFIASSNSKNFQQKKSESFSPDKREMNNIRKSFQRKNLTQKLKHQIDYFGKVKPNMNLQQIQMIKIMYYRDFIWKIWFNSSQKIIPPNSAPKFFIGRGNNSKLIKSLMRKRWWWKMQTKEQNANFLWTQLKVYSVYQEQKCLDPVLQFDLVHNNSQQWNEQKRKSLKDRNGLLMTKSNYEIWRKYITQNKKTQLKANQLLECRKNLQKKFTIHKQFPKKVSNHLQFSRMIGNKKALYKTMTLYLSLTEKPNKYLPLTYHITGGLEDEQYLKFLNEYYFKSKNMNKTSWIVKPGQMSNRGNGIVVCKDLKDIKKIIKNSKCHANGKPFTYIIQQYLDRPLLYNGRKFDIRHFIMITSSYGRIQGYFYEEGYLRTTSYKYTTSNQNPFVHLTNDAVQKNCKDYGKYEQGNKISYQEFEQYLQTKYQGKHSFFRDILPQIRKISIQLINSCYYLIDPKRRSHNFQIFGLDVMIDQDFKPWLIQANTNPCLQLSSKILTKMIPKMLDNAFTIAVDPLFPPPSDLSIKRLNLAENAINENKFELIFDEAVDGNYLNRIYKESDKNFSLMQGFASDQQAYQSAEDGCQYDY